MWHLRRVEHRRFEAVTRRTAHHAHIAFGRAVKEPQVVGRGKHLAFLSKWRVPKAKTSGAFELVGGEARTHAQRDGGLIGERAQLRVVIIQLRVGVSRVAGRWNAEAIDIAVLHHMTAVDQMRFHKLLMGLRP